MASAVESQLKRKKQIFKSPQIYSKLLRPCGNEWRKWKLIYQHCENQII